MIRWMQPAPCIPSGFLRIVKRSTSTRDHPHAPASKNDSQSRPNSFEPINQCLALTLELELPILK